jgi:dipeptidase E
MRKLFLASYAVVVLDLIKSLLPRPASELTVAFIPTAGDPYEDHSFIDVEMQKLKDQGFKVINVDLKNQNQESLRKALENVDVLLVAGGNTFYLLDHVRKSGFDKLLPTLLDQGVIYIGSSAGSVLCCPTIEGAKRFDDPAAAPDLVDFTGLNLIDKIILPHVQKEKYAERLRLTQAEMEAQGYEVIRLTDDQMVLVEGKTAKMMSDGKLARTSSI